LKKLIRFNFLLIFIYFFQVLNEYLFNIPNISEILNERKLEIGDKKNEEDKEEEKWIERSAILLHNLNIFIKN
jgi:hypothetical protein